MMEWTAESIRALRLRLGWDLCQFSRRLGLDLGEVRAWEVGDQAPDEESLRNINQLKLYADQNSLHVSQQPVADILMSDNGLEQITMTDVVNSQSDTDSTTQ